MAGDQAQEFEWAALARVVHPARVAIIEALRRLGQPLSPTDLMNLFEDPKNYYLTLVSYHARQLATAGVLEVVDRRRVRGWEQRFYAIPDHLTRA